MISNNSKGWYDRVCNVNILTEDRSEEVTLNVCAVSVKREKVAIKHPFFWTPITLNTQELDNVDTGGKCTLSEASAAAAMIQRTPK